METMSRAEILKKNCEFFEKQMNKVFLPKSMKKFMESYSKTLAICPASTRREYTCCYDGGLVEHSLRVLILAAKLRDIYGEKERISGESIIKVSLLHDIGKLGEVFDPYYLDETSDWHRTKLGQYYKVNTKWNHYSVPNLSLYLAAKYGFELNENEWYSISSLRNFNTSNRSDDIPVSSEPMLAIILQQAVRTACNQGKEKIEAELVA